MLISLRESPSQLRQFFHAQPPLPYLLVEGDAVGALRSLPPQSVDAVITSPPYWSQREYAHPDALGSEEFWADYVKDLLYVFAEVKKVLHRGDRSG